MIVAQLQRYLKSEIGDSHLTEDASIAFAVAFCYLLARHLPESLTEDTRKRVVTAFRKGTREAPFPHQASRSRGGGAALAHSLPLPELVLRVHLGQSAGLAALLAQWS